MSMQKRRKTYQRAKPYSHPSFAPGSIVSWYTGTLFDLPKTMGVVIRAADRPGLFQILAPLQMVPDAWHVIMRGNLAKEEGGLSLTHCEAMLKPEQNFQLYVAPNVVMRGESAVGR